MLLFFFLLLRMMRWTFWINCSIYPGNISASHSPRIAPGEGPLSLWRVGPPERKIYGVAGREIQLTSSFSFKPP